VNRIFIFTVSSILYVCADSALAQIAGVTEINGPSVTTQAVAIGWSAKRQVIGKGVYNDQKEQLGKIEDLIITPDNSISYAILGTGGFIGIGRHKVAIPIELLEDHNGDIVLPGVTESAIRELPSFQYVNE